MDACKSIRIASKSLSFLTFLLVNLIQPLCYAIDDIFLKGLVLLILFQTAVENVEDDCQFIGEMGLRQVEVHVVEDVELPYVEGGTCLHALAYGLKEK